MKKIICLLLSLLAVFSSLLMVGCGKNKVNYNPDNFIADVNNPKIVKEKVTIKFFVPKAAIHGNWEDMLIFKKMEERTNIHIEFEQVPLASYDDKRGLKWESKNDMTDAFFTCNNKDEVTQYAALGALTPFNSDDASDEYSGNYGNLIEKYMPNYKKWMEKYDEISLYTTQRDGNIYSLCSINTEYGGVSTQYLNEKWLKKTDWYGENKRLPETIEELEIILTEFKEKDMNGNGNKNDEIPLSYISGDSTVNFMMSAYGLVGTGIELDTRKQIYDSNKKTFIDNPTYDQIIWVPSTEAYRNYVKTANKWYNEGLIDQYIFENTSSSLSQLGHEGVLGCFASGGAYLVVGEDKVDDYVAIGPLTSAVNKEKFWYEYSYQFDPTILVIPATSPYKREIARWIDVFYDEANVALQSYGEEGVNWVWDNSENGVTANGEEDTWHFVVPDGVERETYRATLTYNAGLGACILQTDWNMRESTPVQARVFKDRATYKDYLKPFMPSMIYTTEQMTKIGIVEAAMSTVTSGVAYFIKGGTSGYNVNSDSDWNAYVAKMDTVGNYEIKGYKKLVEQYQQAYDFYKSKKGNNR